MYKISLALAIAMFSFQASKAQSSEVDFNLASKCLEAMNPIFDNGSARYAALAGSMGALGGDVSAININPASTGVFIESAVEGTMDYTRQSNKAILGNSLTHNEGNFGFNQLGAVFTFDDDNTNWKRFNFGILYDRKDLSKEVQFGPNPNLSNFDYDADGNYIDEYQFEGYEKVLDGKKEKITLTFGTNYKNKLYLGANVNIHSYSTDYEHLYYGYYAENDEVIAFRQTGYPYREVATGLSFGLGAIYRPIPEARLGLAFQSPIGWNYVSTEYDEYYFNELEPGRIDEYIGLGLWEEDRARSAAFLTLSAGAVINKSLALNVDYIRQFNSFNKYKPKSDYIGTNNFLDNFTRDVNEIRMGAEYRYKNFKFRGGYAFTSSPTESFELTNGYIDANNQLSNSTIKDFAQGKSQTIGLGLGYEFEKLFLDLAYQNQSHTYTTILQGGTYVDPGFYPLDFQTNVGEVERKEDHFILSIGINF